MSVNWTARDCVIGISFKGAFFDFHNLYDSYISLLWSRISNITDNIKLKHFQTKTHPLVVVVVVVGGGGGLGA